MRDIMYEIPSNPNIEKCTITKETVLNGAKPEIVVKEEKTVCKSVVKKERQMPQKQNKKETA